MQFEEWFKESHPEIAPRSIQAVLRLVAEEATVPFIARYRKEQTGNLDETSIQAIIDGHESFTQLLKRQAYIVEEIARQEKLTPELKERILATFHAETLEDLYLPYKKKRKTKATVAKEAGLEPLADWIWNCGHGAETPQPGQTLELWALTFRNEKANILDAASAIEGAQDILIERLAENQDLRALVRKATFEEGFVKTEKGQKAEAHSKFEKYFAYQEKISALLEPQHSHRYLAVRRGWTEEELKLSIGAGNEDGAFEQKLLGAFEAAACQVPDSPGVEVLRKAARLAYKAHVFPSIESEVHKALKAVADEAAIKVFAENVRKLLLASPFGPKAVLGVDPGIRTGCKLAVVDDAGRYLASSVMHLHTEAEKESAAKMLGEVVSKAQIRAIAVGNGTAGRETESFIRGALKALGLSVPVVMVNEAGASVYSASEAAREEFPELDVTVRGAISIARRLQDPLAELVKIDPKSIGVGQYQHDVSPHGLKKSLEQVVESCVNKVGVNLNTASYHLLSQVSGIGPAAAKSIVEHRGQNGLFKSRQDLLGVPRFTKKSFEQAAGFLRIPGAENPLDNTGVHPERYSHLEGLAARLGRSVKDFLGSGVALVKQANELRDEVGAFTFDDIVAELEKPGRDPREEFVAFQFRDDIHELSDLKAGMVCPGIVTNVTNFGAFVDIGVHQDGLVHLSQLADRFVKDPREVVSPGDHVRVRVIEVSLEKRQIALSMKGAEEKNRAPGAHRATAANKAPAVKENRAAASNGRKPAPRVNPKNGKAAAPEKKSSPPPNIKRFSNSPFAGLSALLKEEEGGEKK